MYFLEIGFINDVTLKGLVKWLRILVLDAAIFKKKKMNL